jgi:EmrB/QacA subfamily drug resistance transporter
VIVCVALFFGVLNASAVGVVLPDIANDLSVDTGQLGWLMTGFLLIYGIAIPFYGRLADRYGARPLFLLGVVVFSVGSLLSALAPNFSLLLAARIVQAIGGAAVPGLGMTLASRAYEPEARGSVLGVIAATIGAGAAAGPLLGGALSESLGWQSIFFVNAAAALTIPFGLKILPRGEERTGGNLDIFGGVALALLVGGALLIPSEGARSGWTSSVVLAGAVIAIIGLVSLSARQLTASAPFIPREFLRSSRFVALVWMSFAVMAANLAPLVGLPILLVTLHDLSLLEVGLTMLPGAISSSVFGVLAGRLNDRKGARLPIWIGSPLMLLAVLGLSTYAGSSIWVIATFAGILGAGFGLVNTPLAATISRIVRGKMLASALSINSMLFFLGGSFGTAVLMAVVMSRGGDGQSPLNPLHSGVGAGFSDAFLLLAVPVIVAMAHSLALPSASRLAIAGRRVAVQPEPPVTRSWVANCSVPWMPECAEVTAEGPGSVTPVIEAGYESSRPSCGER